MPRIVAQPATAEVMSDSNYAQVSTSRTFHGIAWKVLSSVCALCRRRSPHHACSAFPRSRSRRIWPVVLSYLNVSLARAPRQETGIL